MVVCFLVGGLVDVLCDCVIVDIGYMCECDFVLELLNVLFELVMVIDVWE